MLMADTGQSMDMDSDGTISCSEMCSAIKEAGTPSCEAPAGEDLVFN
jgi:hypothetical protein